jgi:hypothetical protein
VGQAVERDDERFVLWIFVESLEYRLKGGIARHELTARECLLFGHPLTIVQSHTPHALAFPKERVVPRVGEGFGQRLDPVGEARRMRVDQMPHGVLTGHDRRKRNSTLAGLGDVPLEDNPSFGKTFQVGRVLDARVIGLQHVFAQSTKDVEHDQTGLRWPGNGAPLATRNL